MKPEITTKQAANEEVGKQKRRVMDALTRLNNDVTELINQTILEVGGLFGETHDDKPDRKK